MKERTTTACATRRRYSFSLSPFLRGRDEQSSLWEGWGEGDSPRTVLSERAPTLSPQERRKNGERENEHRLCIARPQSERCSSHPRKRRGSNQNSRAFENAKDDTRRVFSSRISLRVIGGSARWLQFSRSHSRQLTPIGVPSALSRSKPAA